MSFRSENERAMYAALTGGASGQILKATGGGRMAAWYSELAFKVKKIDFAPTIADGTETDSGWDLPDDALVMAVVVEVTTADAGITLDVGLLSTEAGGDADGFLDGVSVASTGWVGGDYVVTKTAGVNENYISAVARRMGELLCDHEEELGSDTAGDHGFANCTVKAHPSGKVTAKSVSYTPHGAGGLDSGEGSIYILYVDLTQAI